MPARFDLVHRIKKIIYISAPTKGNDLDLRKFCRFIPRSTSLNQYRVSECNVPNVHVHLLYILDMTRDIGNVPSTNSESRIHMYP
jgi:hypothetical protein